MIRLPRVLGVPHDVIIFVSRVNKVPGPLRLVKVPKIHSIYKGLISCYRVSVDIKGLNVRNNLPRDDSRYTEIFSHYPIFILV